MNKIEAHPRSTEIIELVNQGRLSSEQAARELDVDPAQFRRYLKELSERENDQTMEAYLDGMHAMIQMLGGMIQHLDGMPIEPNMVKMVTSMTREARGLIRDLAELQGRMSAGPSKANVSATAKYNNLVSFLMQNLCGECRTKVGKALAQSATDDLSDLK